MKPVILAAMLSIAINALFVVLMASMLGWKL